ncbi:MAG: SIMPL domain-containing protein, partial [Alphaproteobacteria bacterium]
DRVSVLLQVKNLDKNAGLASQKSIKTYNKIAEYVVGLQKEYPEIELETTEYNTYEKTEWDSNLKKNVKLGVENIIGLSITSPKIELVGTILTEVSKFSDVYPNGLNTFVSKDVIKKERADCLEKAILNAKDKAQEMAGAVNQSIGKMIYANSYDDSFATTSNTRMMFAAKSAGSMYEEESLDMAPTIFTGNADISLRVDVKFELK